MDFFCTLSSGSSGNCAVLCRGKTSILIDAGVSARKIALELSTLSMSLADLTAVVITHEHIDHVRGLATLLKRRPMPVYVSEGTLPGLIRQTGISCVSTFLPGEEFEIGGVAVGSFRTPHDTPESVGYVFYAGRTKLCCATDLGFVPTEALGAIAGSDILMIESNHDVDMLKTGGYPMYLKKRILGPRGHLSNPDAAEAVRFAAENGTRQVVLAHLSTENNLPSLALREVERVLQPAGGEVCVCTAPRCERGQVLQF